MLADFCQVNQEKILQSTNLFKGNNWRRNGANVHPNAWRKTTRKLRMISTGWSWTNLTKCGPRTTDPAWSIRTMPTWRTPQAPNKHWTTASVESKPVCWRTKPTSASFRNNRGRLWRNPTPRWPAGQVRVKRSSRSWKPPKWRFLGRRSSLGRQLNRPGRRPPPSAPPRVPCLRGHFQKMFSSHVICI